jgi:hypothetical protein
VIIAQRNFNSAQGCHIGIIGGTAGDAAINFGDKDDADIGRITYNNADNSMRFLTNTSEAARITNAQTLLVGKTDDDNTVGFKTNTNSTYMVASGQTPTFINRLSDDGNVLEFRKDSATAGAIAVKDDASNPYMIIGKGSVGMQYASDSEANSILPARPDNQNLRDAGIDLGASGARFKDLYRSGSTISTSDRNQKQDIRDLTDAERNVAVAAKGLLKAFRFIDVVAVEGDSANIHFGIIAQDLAAAFTAEGLDANDYQVYRADTFTDDDGNEQTRLGICYENLLAFIIAAI